MAFTGSTEAGRVIGEVCGRLLRPAALELGGKSAAIVLDDADLGQAVRGLAGACLLNSGQTCYASSRILAPRSRYSEAVDAVAALATSLRVGDPSDPATGWARSPRPDSATASSRTSTPAGPAGLERGWFVEPTVFADVDNSAVVAREEISGPVGVNFYNIDLGAPFGGVKAGGLGRERSPERPTAYVEYKSVHLRR